jgi:hypothetical protein
VQIGDRLFVVTPSGEGGGGGGRGGVTVPVPTAVASRSVTRRHSVGRPYRLLSRHTHTGETTEEDFDFVVLAAPRGGRYDGDEGEISLSGLRPSGARSPAEAPRCAAPRYQPVHVTLVWGVLEPRYFGKTGRGAAAAVNRLSDIFFGEAADSPLSSIGKVGLANSSLASTIHSELHTEVRSAKPAKSAESEGRFREGSGKVQVRSAKPAKSAKSEGEAAVRARLPEPSLNLP